MKKLTVIIAALALTACTASQIETSITAGLAGAQALLAILSTPGANGQAPIPAPVATQIAAYMTCATDGLSVASGIAGSNNPTVQNISAIDKALGDCILSPQVLSQLPANAFQYVTAVQAAVKAVLVAYGVAPAPPTFTAKAVTSRGVTVVALPHPGMVDRMKIRRAGDQAKTLGDKFAVLYAKGVLASH